MVFARTADNEVEVDAEDDVKVGVGIVEEIYDVEEGDEADFNLLDGKEFVIWGVCKVVRVDVRGRFG